VGRRLERLGAERGVDPRGGRPGPVVAVRAQDGLDLGRADAPRRRRARPALQEGQRRDGARVRAGLERGRERVQQVLAEAVEQPPLVAPGPLVLPRDDAQLLDGRAARAQRPVAVAVGQQDPRQQLGVGRVGLAPPTRVRSR
jgi:hypothetical protein